MYILKEWPSDFEVVQIRVARPTNQLKEIKRFYVDGLGLKEIDSFENHEGYSGIMIGLPGAGYHLEFTEYEQIIPCSPPSKDNLLVFYMPNLQHILSKVEQLNNMGFPCKEPENPFWNEKGYTIEDPDGWRIVLMNTSGI